MLLGLYGGMMRGGNTDSTVVVGDEPLLTPPIVPRSWSAIAMHDEFWEPIDRSSARARLFVLVNEQQRSRTKSPCPARCIGSTRQESRRSSAIPSADRWPWPGLRRPTHGP